MPPIECATEEIATTSIQKGKSPPKRHATPTSLATTGTNTLGLLMDSSYMCTTQKGESSKHASYSKGLGANAGIGLNHGHMTGKERQAISNQKSWSSFFTKNDLISLEYTPPAEDKDVLQLPAGTSIEGELKWENTLVGFFIDKKLPNHFVSERLSKAWK